MILTEFKARFEAELSNDRSVYLSKLGTSGPCAIGSEDRDIFAPILFFWDDVLDIGLVNYGEDNEYAAEDLAELVSFMERLNAEDGK